MTPSILDEFCCISWAILGFLKPPPSKSAVSIVFLNAAWPMVASEPLFFQEGTPSGKALERNADRIIAELWTGPLKIPWVPWLMLVGNFMDFGVDPWDVPSWDTRKVLIYRKYDLIWLSYMISKQWNPCKFTFKDLLYWNKVKRIFIRLVGLGDTQQVNCNGLQSKVSKHWRFPHSDVSF